MKKIIAIIVAFVVVIGGVIGIGIAKKSANKSSNTIKIGGVFDTSGAAAAYGQAEKKVQILLLNVLMLLVALRLTVKLIRCKWLTKIVSPIIPNQHQ